MRGFGVGPLPFLLAGVAQNGVRTRNMGIELDGGLRRCHSFRPHCRWWAEADEEGPEKVAGHSQTGVRGSVGGIEGDGMLEWRTLSSKPARVYLFR